MTVKFILKNNVKAQVYIDNPIKGKKDTSYKVMIHGDNINPKVFTVSEDYITGNKKDELKMFLQSKV